MNYEKSFHLEIDFELKCVDFRTSLVFKRMFNSLIHFW